MIERFSANLSFLFGELPMLDRFEAAAAAGFRGVEYMFPYDYEIGALRARLREHRLEQVLFNLPCGDFAAGERGLANDPGRVAEFRAGVAAAAAIAPELGCRRINCLAGIAVPGVPAERQRATLIENLRFAAAELERAGVTLMVEPLNRVETPGFAIGTSGEAVALIDEIGSANLRLQFDCYHAQRVEGNLIDTLHRLIDRIGHVQIADSPARHEPGTGEIAYDRVLPSLMAMGYDGWIGLEYKPSAGKGGSFDWIERYGFAAERVPA
jgi:hydroxypyruvate isomerase